MREEVIDWLRDAYAMESGLEVSLRRQAEALAPQSDLRQKLELHLEETRMHAETVRALLGSLGTDVSTLKTGVGKLAETMKGLGARLARDEPVKEALSSYAMEHFEIACYSALTTAAEEAGLPEVAAACQRIIADEKRMADWLDSALPQIVREYLKHPVTAAA